MIAEAAATPSSAVLADLVHVAPMTVVALWALLLLLADAFSGTGSRVFQRRLGLAGALIAGLAAVHVVGDPAYDGGHEVFFRFLVVDQFSALLDLALVGVLAAVLLFSGDYARSHRFEYGEQEPLLFVAVFGMMMLVHANDLAGLFLGIETLSLALYVMVGARWNSRRSPEAALKYFIMGAVASALLLFGIALVYGALGTLRFTEMRPALGEVFTRWGAAQPAIETLLGNDKLPLSVAREAERRAVMGMAQASLLLPGLLLVLAGLLFKLGAVPMHMWTPDVYEGAPSPTTGFMAAGVKIAAVAALLKVFVGVTNTHRLVTAPYGWTSVVAWVALATMVVGNFAAVRQTNVKRLLAYSSIAHVGYLLIGVVAAGSFYGQTRVGAAPEQIQWAQDAGDGAVSAVLYYVITYAVATLGAFACVSWMGSARRELLSTHEWAGLGQRHPGMALSMSICLLSLMGMPPTAGFVGKLYVFRAAFENDNLMLRVLVVAALINSVVGAYYYLRLVVAMYFREPAGEEVATLPSRGAPAVLAAAAVLTLSFGLAAGAVLERTDLAAAGFSQGSAAAKKARVEAARAKIAARTAVAPGEPEVKTDAKAGGEAQVEAKAGAEPEAKAEAKPEAKAEAKPEAKAESGASSD